MSGYYFIPFPSRYFVRQDVVDMTTIKRKRRERKEEDE
jgi:hypothetical protein